MITILDDFLEKNELENIFFYIQNNVQKPVWRNNLAWDAQIRRSSNPVWILPINDELNLNIKNQFIKNNFNVQHLKITAQFYCWTPLSHIPFHNDDQKILSATIYLNKVWDKNYGGLYLYEENSNIKAVIPKFNRCVINDSSVEHAVSIISMDAPYRETIQIFFTNV